MTKERHSLTLDQRRELRRWANDQSIRPSHKSCIDWFYGQYGQAISQSTVSHSLSPKYSRLDGDNPQLSGSRLRFGNWPDVEKLVLKWYQQVLNTGRHPTNEELGEKAKVIFSQLPRYKDEEPPEFSPGWIHRFKKRYNLLIRRQRRHGDPESNPAEDFAYLVDYLPRIMTVTAETSPAAIKEQLLRATGTETSLNTCALVRDEVVRRMTNPTGVSAPLNGESTDPAGEAPIYNEDDPEVVLQNALRALQQEEAEAEATAAAVREERERAERAGLPPPPVITTPIAQRASSQPHYPPPPTSDSVDLNLTPIPAEGPVAAHDRPVRCPFCLNQRMLRTIKEAVEHLSTHVVV
jgi:hypothetical protein